MNEKSWVATEKRLLRSAMEDVVILGAISLLAFHSACHNQVVRPSTTLRLASFEVCSKY